MTEVADLIAEQLAAGDCFIGQLCISKRGDGGLRVTHRDDRERADLQPQDGALAGDEISRFDDAGKFRPLKTAPNLRHGWELRVAKGRSLHEVIEQFYPGRLAALHAWRQGSLTATPFRQTLGRQSGMYRVSAKINDGDADRLIGEVCRSAGGCLRTILWRRDGGETMPSSLLPPEKYDPAFDQTGGRENALPLLCQESCNLLVAAAREEAKRSSLG